LITIGIDIGGTKIAAGFLDEEGKLKGFTRANTEDVFAAGKDAASALQIFLDGYIDKQNLNRDLIKGVGVGVPSVLDSHTLEVVSTPYIPKLNHYPLSLLLSPKIGVPVFVENDVNLIAIGEHLFGRGKGLSHLACVFVGTGLGCGLILNNQLYTGADGAAAEFGHMIYDHEGRICGCGATDCFETYCSGFALTYEAKRIFSQAEIDHFYANGSNGEYSLAKYLITKARNGHEEAKAAIEKSFQILGIAITDLVNLLNPQLVILGGGIMEGWPEALEIVKDVVHARARTVTRNRLVIDYPILKDKAGLYGAASLVNLKLNG
jgi:glucokinase